MRALILLFSFGLIVAVSTPVEGAVKKSKKPAKSKTKIVKSELHTSHNFDDHGVHGQYQMPDEALAKVENEKSLTDLLGVRKHFKDRLLEASEQE